MALLTLHCLLAGESLGKVFIIRISPEANVIALKNAIKQEIAIDVADLELLKPTNPVKVEDPSMLVELDNPVPLFPPLVKISSFFADSPQDVLHVVVRVIPKTYRINCLFWDHDVNDMFPVEISFNATVFALKGLIEEKHPNSSDFQLVRAPLKRGNDLTDELATLDIDKQPRLSPIDQISDAFLDAPKGYLHVTVVPLSEPRKRVQSRPPSLSPHDRLKRTKFAIDPPSETAKPAYYEKMQSNPSQKILDDRPSADPDIPPIALLYPPFGTFSDFISGRADIVDHLTLKQLQDMEKDVDNFAQAMSRLYTNEDSRRDAGLSILNRVIPCLLPLKSIYSPASIGTVRSDGHIIGPHGVVTSIAEFRNELPRVVPIVEAVGYFVHSEVNMDKDVFEKYRMPCLGITIVGPDIKFYAILTLGSQQRVVSLAQTYSCLESTSDGNERKALFTAFAAASVLLSHITRDVEIYHRRLSPVITGTHRFPDVSKLRKYGGRDDEYLDFTIEDYHPLRQNYRQLYYARDSHNTRILVKFSRRYCLGLHEYCLRDARAPKIIGFELLAGGWYAIAMEDLSDASPLDNHHLEEPLMALVKGFHAEGLVHGDLRETNILCSGDKLWLVDFDWGGKDGEVKYPTTQLNPELMAGRTQDLIIRKEDDLRILRNTFIKLKRQI